MLAKLSLCECGRSDRLCASEIEGGKESWASTYTSLDTQTNLIVSCELAIVFGVKSVSFFVRGMSISFPESPQPGLLVVWGFCAASMTSFLVDFIHQVSPPSSKEWLVFNLL